MSSELHVDDNELSPQSEEKPSRKIEKTVLDSFSNLVNPQEKIRVKSSANLLKHLIEKESAENGNEAKYALGRIVRGLGSPSVSARTGFYTALVALINFKDDVTLADIFDHLNKQLHKAGSNSKGENADVCVGQILTCGAIMRSHLWAKSAEEDQKKIIELLLKNCKERMYLTLVAYMFIVDMFEKVTEKEMQRIFLLIKEEFAKPWAEQNIDTLYLLVSVKTKYPNLVKTKFLSRNIGTEEIICSESLEQLSSVLMTIPRMTALKHPVYEIISKLLAESEHLPEFLKHFDSHLQKPNRNKQLIAAKVYSIALENVKDPSVIPDILTKNFIQQTLNYFKTIKGKERDAEFQQNVHKLFEILLEAVKPENVRSETKIAVLRKLLFYPGTFIFEKITRSKIIQQITSSLNNEGVQRLALVYRGVIEGTERIDSNNAQNDNWLNNDRLYAAHLLIKLLNHVSVKSENEWKVDQFVFLMNLGLFKQENGISIGSELAASLKTAFFGSLDLKLTKLDDLQIILYKLVQELNSKLNMDNLETVLRNPIAKEDFEIWLKAMEVIVKIEKKKKKGQVGLKSVFLSLFLHMALQLFNDTKLASASLKELFVCYEKTRKNRKNSANLDDADDIIEDGDPLWIEVVTDLFLNLLSHNYHLLRSLIKCVFPHLCQYMSPATIQQILSVLDPKNEDNPLSKSNEETSEEEEEDSEQEEDEQSNQDSEEEDEHESESEEETVNNKLRIALHKALSSNGYQTDEESVDLDQLSDTEGERLNEALGEAFKQFKPNHGRRKKQSKDQEMLTHFRVRVLDLIDIYLDSTPSMMLSLEIMLPLLQGVEFSIRDEHQKPLHDRLKACLKKLSTLKKFSDTDGVNEAVLSDLLKSLLDKGTKNAMIVQDMGVQIAECCLFVIRCSDLLGSQEATPKKARKVLKRSIADIVKGELEEYFHKRDCLTPYVLFKNTMQLSWDGTLTLVPQLLGFIFSNDIKPFKKTQAVELLRLFYANQRYLGTKPEKIKAKLSAHHMEFSGNVNEFFRSLCENSTHKTIKEKFVCNLFNLLNAMKCSRLNIDNIIWPEIAQNIREYRSYVSFSKDAKTAFNKLCHHLGVSHIVKMKPQPTNLSNSIKEDDTDSMQSKDKTKKDKQKKKRVRNKENLKLKKEAKELRLNSLSEGFVKFDFTSTTDIRIEDSENEDDNTKSELNGTSDGKKKKRKNNSVINGELTVGDVSEIKKKRKSSSSANKTVLEENFTSKDKVKSQKRLSNSDSVPKKKKKVVQ